MKLSPLNNRRRNISQPLRLFRGFFHGRIWEFVSLISSLYRSTKYCSPFTAFFARLLKLSNRVSADVYAYIFLCDFINFFVLLFGFTSFGVTQSLDSWIKDSERIHSGLYNYRERKAMVGFNRIWRRIRFRWLSWSRCWYNSSSSLSTEPCICGKIWWEKSYSNSSVSSECIFGCSFLCRNSANAASIRAQRRSSITYSNVSISCCRLTKSDAAILSESLATACARISQWWIWLHSRCKWSFNHFQIHWIQFLL